MVDYVSDLEGNNIITDGKRPLEPSEQTNSIVSDYLSYGSFSGTDIKVVVHYPYSQRAQQAIQRRKRELESRYASIEPAQSPQQLITNEQEQLALQGEIDLLDNELKSVEDIPTSKVLGEIQTISWSIFREKSPVRTLGSVYPRAYVRGPRTIGGSMIFTVFHQHVLHELLALNLGMFSTGTSDHDNFRYSTNLADQVPPIDISLLFANEYGAISHMGLWGVEFVQEGGTFSIEDIYSESQVQYVARDLDPMRLVNTRKTDGSGVTKQWTKTASNLLYEEQSLDEHLRRRDPFI